MDSVISSSASGARRRITSGEERRSDARRQDARPVEIGVAPVEIVDGFEVVVDDAFDRVFLEGRAVSGFAERAVVAEAAGAASDLREFIRAQIATLATVELAA